MIRSLFERVCAPCLVGWLPSLWQVLVFRSDTVMVEADWSVDLTLVDFTRVSAWQVAVALAGGIPNCPRVCWGHAGDNWHAGVRDSVLDVQRLWCVICNVCVDIALRSRDSSYRMLYTLHDWLIFNYAFWCDNCCLMQTAFFSPQPLCKNCVHFAVRTCLVLSGIVQRGTVKISVVYLN